MLNIIWGVMIVGGIAFGAVSGNMEAVGNGIMDSAKEAVSLAVAMMGVVALWSGLMEIAKEAGIVAGATRLLRPVIRFLFPKIPEGDESLEHITVNVISNIFGLGAAATPAGLKAMKALERLEEKRVNEAEREVEKRNERVGMQTGERIGKVGMQADEGEKTGERIGTYTGQTGGKRRNVATKNSYGKGKNTYKIQRAASNEMCTFLVLNISSLQLIPVNMIAYRSQYGSVNPMAVVGPAIIATLISTLAAVIFSKVMCRGE